MSHPEKKTIYHPMPPDGDPEPMEYIRADLYQELRLIAKEQHLCLQACDHVFTTMGMPSNPEIGLGNIIALYEVFNDR